MLTRRDNASGYSATMGSIDSKIVVGGRTLKPTEFLPAMNASFHDDEAWLDINHIDSVIGSRTDTLEDGVIAHSNGFKHEFYTVDDGRLKWDMLFDNAGVVPSTIRFSVKHSDNLSFYRQFITPEQYAEGNRYVVPEAENSFAVYFNNGKRDNKYQTGKCCHIYSPFYVDEVGEESPLLDMDLTYTGRLVTGLILSNTQKVVEWLNDPKRVGKIRLDPTLGYDTVGGSSTVLVGNVWHAAATQSDATGGEVQSLHIAVGKVQGTSVKASVANCDQTTPWAPAGHSLIAEAESTNLVLEDDHVLDDSFTTYASVLPNTYYRIGVGFQNASAEIKYDSVSSNFAGAYGIDYPNEMRNPVPAGAITNSVWISAWAEYAAVAAATFNRSRIVNMGATGPQNRSTIANA